MVVLNYIVHLLTKFVFSLPQATAYIFTDMQTKDRHAHAMECYYVTARRCGALLQWISQVCCSFIVYTNYILHRVGLGTHLGYPIYHLHNFQLKSNNTL